MTLIQQSKISDIWLRSARKLASPNFDERPDDNVDLLVIHNISLPPGQFQGNHIEDFFCNRLDPGLHPYFETIADMRVSAHLLIRRDGQVIQFVPLNRRAWHAGVSSFQGRESCNDYSIGIELEGTDDLPYTEPQYRKLAEVTELIRRHYPAITKQRITGHCNIAPKRKTDPGPAFDWADYLGRLK